MGRAKQCVAQSKVHGGPAVDVRLAVEALILKHSKELNRHGTSSLHS